MRVLLIETNLVDWQRVLYERLNTFADTCPVQARLCAIPVALLDVGMNILIHPVRVINDVASAVFNLLGILFSNQCTLKNILNYTESALLESVCIPVKVLMAPVHVIFQVMSILVDPKKVQSIDEFEAFKEVSIQKDP